MTFQDVINILKDKHGLEFGGPTELFSNPSYRMFLYSNVRLDGGNIIENNHFQSSFSEKYNYGGNSGQQFNVDCAGDLSPIEKKYDFIVTSHVIEHIANPIKAIKNWGDLLGENGYILSIIPDYRYCFDRNRPLTTIEHLIDDYKCDVGEDDRTHIEEQKKLHDWTYGGHGKFYELCEVNYKTRVVHHHTFTPETVENLMKEAGFKSIITFKHDDLNIVNLSQKNG